MRMRRKKNLFPRLERCEAVTIHEPTEMKGRWQKTLGGKELYIELGCGKGRFTAGLAETIPEDRLVAVERVADAIVVAMERVIVQGIENVRFICSDVKWLSEMFAKDEVSGIYINFCDPWPSRKNEAKRLTAPGFLKSYREVLKPKGKIFFKTDNQDLFTYSLKQFETCGYSLSEVTRDLHANCPCGIMTDYEAKFYEQGLPICRCVATKKPLMETDNAPTEVKNDEI